MAALSTETNKVQQLQLAEMFAEARTAKSKHYTVQEISIEFLC